MRLALLQFGRVVGVGECFGLFAGHAAGVRPGPPVDRVLRFQVDGFAGVRLGRGVPLPLEMHLGPQLVTGRQPRVESGGHLRLDFGLIHPAEPEKRFAAAGVPLYLVEAKAEPGNHRMVQISPTLQATFSNLKRAHAGRKPRFAEYFEAPAENGVLVHYDQWMSEDGGRLTNKRNKGMIVEAPADKPLEAPDGFMWLSLWQIKECFHEDACINPHLRMLRHL